MARILLVLFVAWAVALATYVWLQRDLTFVVDEGDWVTYAGTRSLPSFIEPFNGHLILVPLFLFRLILDLSGTSYLGFTLAEFASLVSLSAALFYFALPRIGASLALVPAVLPLFLGAGWSLLLQPLIGLEWLLSLSLGLWALVLMDRRTVWSDLLASFLLIASLATFSVGLSFLTACGLSIVLIRRTPLRLWVPVLPLSLYVAWTLIFNQNGASFDPSNIFWIPPYILDSISAATAALFGQNLPYGPGTSLKLNGFSWYRLFLFLAEGFVIVTVGSLLLRRYRNRGLAWAPLLVALSVPFVLFTLQALQLAELRRPIEFRYLPGSVVTLALPAVELLRGVTLTRRVAIAVGIVSLLSITLGIQTFRGGRAVLLTYSKEARATMFAFGLAGGKADQQYVPAHENLTSQSSAMFFSAGTLLAFSERYGNPGYSEGELLDQGQLPRRVADIQLVRSYRIELNRTSGASCSTGLSRALRNSTLTRRGGTFRVRLAQGETLGVSRFASSFVRLPPAPYSGLYDLSLPRDRSEVPWRVRIPHTASITECLK